jgi:hypothetical protein
MAVANFGLVTPGNHPARVLIQDVDQRDKIRTAEQDEMGSSPGDAMDGR